MNQNNPHWDIFLSHSSKDKTNVERLARDLKEAGASVWLDVWEMTIGDTLTRSIQAGLKNSRYVGIWITNNAITSGWVEKEWTSRLKDEIEDGHVIVLPLLAEKCKLPLFLQDKIYADFTSDYASAFDQLLKTIQIIPRNTGRKILAFTKDILDDLSDEVIPLPLNGKIKIVETLKRMPRSGKLVRLKDYLPKIMIRSVYDHILSVAYSADCLFSHVQHGVEPHEMSELARCIAFHELNEVILGDMPSYTNISRDNMRAADLYAWKRLKDIDKRERERVANEFISRAPRIISKSQRFFRHEEAAKEAAEKKNAISTIDKIA